MKSLQSKVLFRGMSAEEIRLFLDRANPYYVRLYGGRSVRIEKKLSWMMGLVISGWVMVYSADYDGKRTLLRVMESGETSGMVYSLFDYQNTLVEFVAVSDAEMIMFSPEVVFVQEPDFVVVQHKLLVNLISGQRRMFEDLTAHLSCLSQRTVRDKVLRFLCACAERAKKYELNLPLTREETADYLAVDRASLSRTLGELKQEGIIDFSRNHFRILKPEKLIF